MVMIVNEILADIKQYLAVWMMYYEATLLVSLGRDGVEAALTAWMTAFKATLRLETETHLVAIR